MVEGKLITTSTQHSQACNLSAFLSRKIHDIAVPDTLRNRIAGACFSITLDHFDAILVLLGHKHPIYASAYSLMRVEFESYIRGIWLLNCASDEKIENFAKGELGIFPDTKSLICAVEKVSGFDGQQLTKTYIENGVTSVNTLILERCKYNVGTQMTLSSPHILKAKCKQ